MTYRTRRIMRQGSRVHRDRNRAALALEATPSRPFIAIVDRFGCVAGLVASPSAARHALTAGGLT